MLDIFFYRSEGPRIQNIATTDNQMNSITVLVVEDNPDDAILIGEFLAEEAGCHYKSEVVTSLAGAIAALSGSSFDVVLLDLSLPDSTGLDTVRQLVSRFPEVAIIVLTGLSDDKLAVLAVSYGAQDYLEKKYISSMWLGRAIRYAIERKRYMRQKEGVLADLSTAIKEIDMLRRVLPICASCKKIRNGHDEWEPVEQYLKSSIGADTSPSICPECTTMLYPEIQDKRET